MRRCDSFTSKNWLLFGRQSYITHRFHAHFMLVFYASIFLYWNLEECCLLSRNGTHLAIWAVAYMYFIYTRITQFTPLCNFFTEITHRNNSTHYTMKTHILRIFYYIRGCVLTINLLIICYVHFYTHIHLCVVKALSGDHHSQIPQALCRIFHVTWYDVVYFLLFGGAYYIYT
jgi:hypothetical protein